MKLFVYFNIVLLFIATCFVQADIIKPKGKRIYQTVRIQGERPNIDGVLDDACWQDQGVWASKFRQFKPNNYADPTRETEFKILYDDDNLYIAFRCFDDPDSIEIQVGRRDVDKGDVIGATFDSYHDLRTAYEFNLTAAGCKSDMLIKDGRFMNNWNAVWYGDVAMEDSAWTAEMRVPLSQLRFSNKEEHIWGLHVKRFIYRNQEEDQWNVFAIDATTWANNFGELHGIRDLKKQRRIELLPYSLLRQDLYPEQPGNPFADGSDFKYNLGLDGKIGLSSNFTMDFTVNPDFGQVEADPSVLNLSAFETFYDEKRPFFLEGNSIFDFSLGSDQLFYSRRIGHRPQHNPALGPNEYADTPGETTILNALKVTGKTSSGLSLGIIQSITPVEKAEIDRAGERSKQTVEPWSNYFLTRLLQDFNSGNTSLGGMITSTKRFIDSDDTHLDRLATDAVTGGVDFLHRWNNRAYFLDAKAVFSHISGDELAMMALQNSSGRYYGRPDVDYIDFDSTRTSLSGYGGRVSAGKSGLGKWHYSETISWKSPGLDLNDLGYMRMADLISQESSLSWNINRPNGFYRSYNISMSQGTDWDFGGRMVESEYSLSTYWSFVNFWSTRLSISRDPQWLETRLLRGGPALAIDGDWDFSMSVNSDRRQKFSYSLSGSFEKVDDDVSSNYNIQPGVSLRIGSRYNLSSNINYSHNVDDVQYITTVNYNNDKRYLLGRIDQDTWSLTLRTDYAFTPNLIVQYYISPYISTGEYSHIKYVQDADADDRDDRFHTFSGDEITENGMIAIDENSDGNTDYSIMNPDFNFKEMHSNLVLRWEFTPGSTFYFVWTHGRSEYLNGPAQSLSKNTDQLFSVKPINVFMVKLNYWFTL